MYGGVLVKSISIVSFLPEEFIPLIMVSVGFLIIIGQRKLAGAMFTLILVMIFLPVLLEPLLGEMPLWVLLSLGFFVVFSILGSIIDIVVGKKVRERAAGILLADFIRGLFKLPWRITKFIFGIFFRR